LTEALGGRVGSSGTGPPKSCQCLDGTTSLDRGSTATRGTRREELRGRSWSRRSCFPNAGPGDQAVPDPPPAPPRLVESLSLEEASSPSTPSPVARRPC
jgi:hypothetical protein